LHGSALDDRDGLPAEGSLRMSDDFPDDDRLFPDGDSLVPLVDLATDGDPLILFPSEQTPAAAAVSDGESREPSPPPSRQQSSHVVSSDSKGLLLPHSPQTSGRDRNTSLGLWLRNRVRMAAVRRILARSRVATSSSTKAVYLSGCRLWQHRSSPVAFGVSTFLCGVTVGALLMELVRLPAAPAQTRPADDSAAASGIVSSPRLPESTPARASVAGVQPGSPVTVDPARSSNRPPKDVATTAAPVARRTTRTAFRGSLTVQSRPEGAEVYINGRRAGTTPVRVRSHPIGSQVVRITLSGYEVWTSAVRVVANQEEVVVANLQRPPPWSLIQVSP
jgi:hypothetical protein